MSYFPVMLMTYNRAEYTKKVVESLAHNTLASQTDLYIFCDGVGKPEHAAAVLSNQDYARSVQHGFKSVTVIVSPTNQGVFKATIAAGHYMYERYEAFIGLEDDIFCHPYFLQYMNDALNYYKNDPRIAVVMGYCHEPSMQQALKHYEHDMVFSYAFHSFGWGMWKEHFNKVDWTMQGVENYLTNSKQRKQGRMLSWGHLRAASTASKPTSELWDIRLSYYLFKNDLLCAWPRYSYTNNFGFDGSGLHKYSFANDHFAFALVNAQKSHHFTRSIDMSPKLHFGIEVAISARWTIAFLGNFRRLVSHFFKKLFFYEQAKLAD